MPIAVVIPALDEAGRVGAAIESASVAGVEVVVVDGGSRDETLREAREAGARVLEGPRGRARQLRLGVENSAGDPVLLLHADTRLPAGWDAAVRAALADPAVAGGAFRLRFDAQGAVYRLLEAGVRLRVALCGLPYGDQAIFVRRSVLERIGGVPEVEVMEDLDLVRGIKRHGRLARLPLPVLTSARRYLEQGAVSTVLRHWIALLVWKLGCDRGRVAKRVRGPGSPGAAA